MLDKLTGRFVRHPPATPRSPLPRCVFPSSACEMRARGAVVAHTKELSWCVCVVPRWFGAARARLEPLGDVPVVLLLSPPEPEAPNPSHRVTHARTHARTHSLTPYALTELSRHRVRQLVRTSFGSASLWSCSSATGSSTLARPFHLLRPCGHSLGCPVCVVCPPPLRSREKEQGKPHTTEE